MLGNAEKIIKNIFYYYLLLQCVVFIVVLIINVIEQVMNENKQTKTKK